MIFGHLEALEQHRHIVEDAITEEITKHEEALSLLCSIPGIDVTAAAAIIAEIGTDIPRTLGRCFLTLRIKPFANIFS